MSYEAVVGGVLVAGLGFAAYLALSKDDSNVNDAGDYDFNAQGIDAAIGRMNTAIDNYWVNTDVPDDTPVTPQAAAEAATISEQQDQIYTPDAGIPIYQGYGTVNDSLKGWQADVASILPGIQYLDYAFEGDKTGTIGNNAYNAYTNQLNAQAMEGMLNFVKWADYEEAANKDSTTLDLSEMEKMAAWLYVNDRKDYDSFLNGWKTMAGVTPPSTTWFGIKVPGVQGSMPQYSNLAYSAQEQSNIQNYINQLESQPKIAQYGDFASTPAPYTTDIQGNAVNAYTGVIMVGDQGPTGGKY